MTRRGTEQRSMRSQLNLRLSRSMLADVEQRAGAAGVSNAEWVRSRLAAMLDDSVTETRAGRPRRRPRPAPKVDVAGVARLREAVGEAVGTLRQVAGLDRSRDGCRLAEIDDAITRLIAAAKDLDDVKSRLLDRGPEQ